MASGNPVPGFINGVNVEQREYTNDSDYKDEWVLQKLYSFTMNHYYDQGYDVTPTQKHDKSIYA